MFRVILSGKLSSKIMSVKLLVIVIIDFKHFPSTYCVMQGSCFISSDFQNFYFKIRITTFKDST